MIRAIAVASRPLRIPSAWLHRALRACGETVGFCRARMPKLDRYHPELHYMRGPGPKWNAKHRPRSQAPAMSGLVDASI